MNLASLFPDVNHFTNTCTACQKQYSTQIKLHRHLKRIHGMNSDCTFKDCRTYCRLCEIFYKNMNSYTAHCCKMHKKGKAKNGFSVYDIAVIAKRVGNHYGCVNCGSHIRNITLVSTHVCRKKQAKTRHLCTFCSKSYIKKTCLNTHIQSTHSQPTSIAIRPKTSTIKLPQPELYTFRNIMTLLESVNSVMEYQLIMESSTSSSNSSSSVTPRSSLQGKEKSISKNGDYDFDPCLLSNRPIESKSIKQVPIELKAS